VGNGIGFMIDQFLALLTYPTRENKSQYSSMVVFGMDAPHVTGSLGLTWHIGGIRSFKMEKEGEES